MYGEATKEDTFIYQPDDSVKEYLITKTGINEYTDDWYNDKLYISFVNMASRGGNNEEL